MKSVSKILLIIILISSSFYLPAQEFFCKSRTDFFNNYYLIESSKVKEYSPDSNLIHIYENNSFGNIDFIDISNPYKFLIVHKSMNKIVITDNKLSVLNTINFIDHNINLSSACWYSVGNILIYDEISSELIVFSISNMEVIMSKSFIVSEMPILMFENSKKLYIATESTFYIFNMFLIMEKKLKLKLSSYAFIKGVVYTNNTSLNIFNYLFIR